MTEPTELLRAPAAHDRFMQVLGMELVDAGPGRANARCISLNDDNTSQQRAPARPMQRQLGGTFRFVVCLPEATRNRCDMPALKRAAENYLAFTDHDPLDVVQCRLLRPNDGQLSPSQRRIR